MNTIYLIRRFIILITIELKSASTQKTNTNTLGKSFYNENSVVSKYLNSVAVMNGSTAVKYRERLKKFEVFLSEHYGSGIDEIIKRIMAGNVDAYNVLGNYIRYLIETNNNGGVSPITLKNYVITIKNFLEYSDIDISPRKFKLKVRLPKVVTKNKETLSKEDVVDILNACSDIRLKTYVMLLAAGGFRAVEALSIRIKDLDLESKPARVFVRGEYTKTKTDRVVFLTEEAAQQLTSWLAYKYRKRRVCYKAEKENKNSEKTISEYRTPDRKENDLIFAVYQNTRMPNPDGIYDDIAKSFAKTLDRMGKGEREDGNERRRQITFHSFRRFVKTTISDLGYVDYSEYFIGHSGSTYWRKKDTEKAEIFRKIESYLTFLNVRQLERQGADIQSKVEELERLNQSMRDRDKMKDDAIAHLSDQLIALTTRLDSIERLQQ
ncbi:MAG: tyrosine-type recombinase/integrase [Candidatus Nitrosopolaris sp.]